MSPERVTEVKVNIEEALRFRPLSAIGARVPKADTRTPEQRLTDAAQRFCQRGCNADDARRRLRILNTTLLDGAVPPDIFERVFRAHYPAADNQAKSSIVLPLVTFSTIMREDLPPVEWDVEDVITRGDRAMFYGEWSSLKSWVALDLALHLAAGRPWLDRFAISKPRRVLYIDEEMNPRTLKRRIKRLGLGLHLGRDDIPFQALSRHGVTLDATGALRLLDELKAAEFTPEVIVIDTLRRVLVGSENEAKDITAFWKIVDAAFVVKNGITVIVLHHMRKPRSSRESARHRGSGTTDIPAGADANVSVERHRKPDHDAVTLGFLKGREGEEPDDCVIRLNDGGEKDGPVWFEYMGTPKDYAATVKQEGKDRIAALVDFVRERGTASTADIVGSKESPGHLMTRFGISDRTAKRDLGEAVEAKRVELVPGSTRGEYRVPA